jgi:biopolymer transport protein TolR
MSMTIGIKKELRSEINITPYIDILLVLLIIFMVVTPVRQHDLKVKVPQPPQPLKFPVEVRSNAIVVTVGERAQIAINSIPADFNSLDSKLRGIYSARRDKNMFISASSNLPYSDVVKVIDISKGVGVIDIGLICQEMH